MLLALYKTAKETYELLREKCCPKKNIDIHPKDDNANSDVKDLKAGGANESVDLQVISYHSEAQIEKIQDGVFGNFTNVNHYS